MKWNPASPLLLSLALACAGVLIWAGCEADSSSESVVISPQSIVVKRGQTVEFKASGGYDYRWSLNPDDGSGALNTFYGDTVIYTCLATNGTSPKKIIVKSTIEGSSTGTTNTPSYSAEAYAEIYYTVPTGSSGTSTNSSSTSTNSPP